MSVVETDDRDCGTVLHYAPRHVRNAPEERSIRPILERLSRGENGARPDVQIEATAHAMFPLDPPRRTSGWELIACSTLSAVLSAGLALVAIGWLSPNRTEPARVLSVQADSKTVETASVQPTYEAVQPGPVSATPDREPETAPPPPATTDAAPPAQTQRDQVAPKEMLAMWSGVPPQSADNAGTTAFDSSPAEATSGSSAAETTSDASVTEETKDEADTSPPVHTAHRGTEHHAEVARRHAHARHRSYRHTRHASHRAAARSEDVTATTGQPVDSNPLQSALQSVFGGGGSTVQQKRPD